MGKNPSTNVRLTPRELEIIRLVCMGKSDAEIAVSLGKSHSTIRFHLKAIYKRLEFSSEYGRGPYRVALTRWAIRNGIIRA